MGVNETDNGDIKFAVLKRRTRYCLLMQRVFKEKHVVDEEEK